MSNQKQKGGDNSTCLQAGRDINISVTPTKNVSHKLDIETENMFFARFSAKTMLPCQGNWGMGFYHMKIINGSFDASFTVKTLKLRYVINGKQYNTDSHVIITGEVYSPQLKKNVNTMTINIGNKNLVCMEWENIRVEIGKYARIEPGGVLTGSAYFILDFKEHKKLRELKDLEFILTDYYGNIPITPQYANTGECRI